MQASCGQIWGFLRVWQARGWQAQGCGASCCSIEHRNAHVLHADGLKRSMRLQRNLRINFKQKTSALRLLVLLSTRVCMCCLQMSFKAACAYREHWELSSHCHTRAHCNDSRLRHGQADIEPARLVHQLCGNRSPDPERAFGRVLQSRSSFCTSSPEAAAGPSWGSLG